MSSSSLETWKTSRTIPAEVFTGAEYWKDYLCFADYAAVYNLPVGYVLLLQQHDVVNLCQFVRCCNFWVFF